ncbi:MAG: hypothetical protein ABSH00_11275 [Bryobacteraceae bacterium]|jgi:hypothetical protein
MELRESVLENIAGDLECHPRRGLIYLGLGAAALCYWILAPPRDKLMVVPLVFGLGSLALLLKGVFLFRKTSEGLGLTQVDLTRLSDPASRKALPSIPCLVAQVVQDFGAGGLLLGPALEVTKDVDKHWEPPIVPVFLVGLGLFLVGWLVRRLTSPASVPS